MIRNHLDWFENQYRDWETNPEAPKTLRDCKPYADGSPRLLALSDRSKLPDGICEIASGESVLFAPMFYLGMFTADKSADAITQIRQMTDNKPCRITITLNGNMLTQDRMWRNRDEQCFSLNTGWSNFNYQENEGAAKPLDSHYADGYWMWLRFDKVGDYTLEISDETPDAPKYYHYVIRVTELVDAKMEPQ